MVYSVVSRERRSNIAVVETMGMRSDPYNRFDSSGSTTLIRVDFLDEDLVGMPVSGGGSLVGD